MFGSCRLPDRAFAEAWVKFVMYGFEWRGIRRYLLLPGRFERVHRAGSAAVFLLGAAMIPPAILVCLAFGTIPFDGRLTLTAVLSAVAGTFYFNAVGLCTLGSGSVSEQSPEHVRQPGSIIHEPHCT